MRRLSRESTHTHDAHFVAKIQRKSIKRIKGIGMFSESPLRGIGFDGGAGTETSMSVHIDNGFVGLSLTTAWLRSC